MTVDANYLIKFILLLTVTIQASLIANTWTLSGHMKNLDWEYLFTILISLTISFHSPLAYQILVSLNLYILLSGITYLLTRYWKEMSERLSLIAFQLKQFFISKSLMFLHFKRIDV